ncbi:SUMF1/EgtB/PvdO family nonheme iron enzyme [Synechocystis salina LEGE 06155]|nr:SUMF1/EgtB/PvdO family nonheme iron enzyme [Synechocystis salina LEGE 06155]
MSQCLNPDCLAVNPVTHKFCQKCGQKLWLKDRYQALKLIGQGGFGKTFLAVDLDKPSRPQCVIKQFFPQGQGTGSLGKAAELFQEEAKRLDDLGNHGQIPELLAYFIADDQRQYLVQEYVEGENLAQELANKGVFNEEKIRALLMDLLPVLDFIHSRQVIHRDIKPENIIRRQSDQKLVLVDFGAAKAVNPGNRSVTGTIIGSAEYVAPEQMNGKAVNASDLYSLGVTCLHLLTGISPFELFDPGEHEWCWRDYLVNNSVSNELGNILEKLVSLGVKKRYQSATDVLKDLGFGTIKVSTQPNAKIPATPKTRIQSGKTQSITENLPGGVKSEMIKIPAGSFMMGSNERDDEKPIHQVTLKEFYLGKYPVTQEQWQAVMRNNPSAFNNDLKNPVERVSWDNCQEFCRKLSNLTKKNYRLPSEAEWEYACRAGTRTNYCFGNDVAQLKEYAWYRNNSLGQTHRVGQKRPNSWDLYDMHGNVWEWCEDDWHKNYGGAPLDGTTWANNYSQLDSKVIRGGSWDDFPLNCYSAFRYGCNRSRNYYYGFRLALG